MGTSRGRAKDENNDEKGGKDKEVLERLEAEQGNESLYDALMRWMERTPIMGSIFESEGDESIVRE